MSNNDIIREAVRRVWKDYILEPKDWREDFGLAPQNIYNSLFCPKHNLGVETFPISYLMQNYCREVDCLLECGNAEYLRKIFNEVKKRLGSDIKELINKGLKGNNICISIVPADSIRNLNKEAMENGNYLHIVYNGLDDYIESEEIADLLRFKELSYFPVILSYFGMGRITNMIPCTKVQLSFV